ncbi:MAG: hypothetical protein N4A49_06035 [Marinifilaceae bacterium]|jgi:hypothetical protein|nr:hypothetical protein [Marinifilaceae bacterium]
MKNINRIVFIFLIGILFSCSKSSLSDIELNNPELLRVNVCISQDENNQREVFVRIRDKNFAPVEFKGGRVLINRISSKYSRSSGNISLMQRGYVYNVLDNYESYFDIEIWYNENDSYQFRVDRNIGFSGFVENQDIKNKEGVDKSYIQGNSTIKDTPFMNGKIEFEYKLLKSQS